MFAGCMQMLYLKFIRGHLDIMLFLCTWSKVEETKCLYLHLLHHQNAFACVLFRFQTDGICFPECERERTRAELEREAKEKECGCRIELENEICNLKSQIASLQKRGYAESEDKEGVRLLETRVLEREAEIKRLKDLLEKERKRGDSECKKAEAEKKKAAEAWKVVKAEKSKAEEEKKLAEIERKKAEECRLCLEATKLEANEVKAKLISGNSKAEETNRKAEAEKQRANKEKKRADLEAVKAEEQRKCAEVERQKATDEKTRADQLSQLLEEERQRKEALQKEMQELLSCGNMNRGCSCSRAKRCGSIPGDHSEKTDTADKKVLNEQLKLEKMQARQAKKIAKIEKVRNNLLQQELDLLKHDAMQFSRRLDMLDECFSHGMEGIDSIAKVGIWIQWKLKIFTLFDVGVVASFRVIMIGYVY